jgi:hypothetical protein
MKKIREAIKIMQTKKGILTAILLCVFLIGCAANYVGKTYDGPELPSNEVGTIRFDEHKKFFGGQIVIPCKLDGIRVDVNTNDRTITVMPGKHTLLFMYDGAGPLVTVEWTFTVEGGHTYLITFPKDQPPSNIMLWLEDLTTGKKVTDITSSPLKGAFSCF